MATVVSKTLVAPEWDSNELRWPTEQITKPWSVIIPHFRSPSRHNVLDAATAYPDVLDADTAYPEPVDAVGRFELTALWQHILHCTLQSRCDLPVLELMSVNRA